MRRLLHYFSSTYTKECIRNFCIIAHIDHGKSTLADRLMQLTETIPRNSPQQYLDKLKVERERGITVQAQTVSMHYTDSQGRRYLFNLVDTPGHVDFHYEVERSMRGCQGALLLVDATQGIQAQTLANYELAMREKLVIIPILNKIDMVCDVKNAEVEMRSELGIEKEVSRISAKTGLNVEGLFRRIIEEIPPPRVGGRDDKLKLFLLNSVYVSGKNVVCIYYVMGGTLKKNIALCSSGTGKSYSVFEVGILHPQFQPQEELIPGQIGYAMSNMKAVREARIGDTFYSPGHKVTPQIGFKPAKPMVYAGVYPDDPNDVASLEKNLEKLVLIDPAVTFVKESNASLGTGFKCGFLGMLHMEVFKQRLDDEFDVSAFLTSPSVPYRCKLKVTNKVIEVDSAADAPDKDKAQYYEEPITKGTIIVPLMHLGEIKALCEQRRGVFLEEKILDEKKCILKYRLPLAQIIVDFVDKLKSLTHGYGSFQYEDDGFERSDIVKLVIHIMNEPVPALTFLIHSSKAVAFGKQVCTKVRETIPAKLFTVNIQARVGTKTIAKEEIAHIKRHVTAKCYGGDYSRKRKLIEKYKEGKKQLRALGSVDVGKETFFHVLKQ